MNFVFWLLLKQSKTTPTKSNLIIHHYIMTEPMWCFYLTHLCRTKTCSRKVYLFEPHEEEVCLLYHMTNLPTVFTFRLPSGMTPRAADNCSQKPLDHPLVISLSFIYNHKYMHTNFDKYS